MKNLAHMVSEEAHAGQTQEEVAFRRETIAPALGDLTGNSEPTCFNGLETFQCGGQ